MFSRVQTNPSFSIQTPRQYTKQGGGLIFLLTIMLFSLQNNLNYQVTNINHQSSKM